MMYRLNLFIFTLSLLMIVSSGLTFKNSNPPRKGKDYALFFANDDYSDTPGFSNLKNPGKDADDLARELKTMYSFETQVYKNQTKTQIFDVLKSWQQKQFEEDDQLFIFFSGHGTFQEFNSKGYFVPKGGKNYEQYIDLTDLGNIVALIKSKHILLAIDACYSGTIDQAIAFRGNQSFRRPNQDQNSERDNLIFSQLLNKSRLLLTSGGKERTPDGANNSPFAAAILKGLRGAYTDGDGLFTFADLLSALERVSPTPHQGELPGHEQGSFVFVAKQQSSQGSFSRPEPESPSKDSTPKEVPTSNGASKKAESKQRFDSGNSSKVSPPIDNINYTFYVADSRRISGGILTLQNITIAGQSSLLPYYSSPSGEIHSATFDKSGNAYYLNANRYDLYKSNGSSETKIYTHTTYVRDIAIDKQGRIYFSEATGGGKDGIIYVLDLTSNNASPYVTVPLQQVGGFWAGDFAFDPDGKLYISNGNQVPAALYEFNGAIFSKRYDFQGTFQGFTFANASTLYFASGYNTVYKLENFQTLTPVFTSNNGVRFTDIDKKVNN